RNTVNAHIHLISTGKIAEQQAEVVNQRMRCAVQREVHIVFTADTNMVKHIHLITEDELPHAHGFSRWRLQHAYSQYTVSTITLPSRTQGIGIQRPGL